MLRRRGRRRRHGRRGRGEHRGTQDATDVVDAPGAVDAADADDADDAETLRRCRAASAARRRGRHRSSSGRAREGNAAGSHRPARSPLPGVQGYKLRLDPPDLARLRELPGSRGKSDTEIGEAFFDGQAERLASSIKDDVPSPSELRVVVDPYSRQAFLALEGTIRGILSF